MTLASWFHPLYRVHKLWYRSLLLRLVKRLEGDEMRSVTLRRIFADYHGVHVGMYSYGCFDSLRIPRGTSVGRYCSFAPGVVIFNANHPLERISTHPFFYNPDCGLVKHETIERNRAVIGHDVWIGRNSIITPRVRSIGNGAAIGAGAVVTQDVPPYAIVAGNPARVIRYRFPPEVQRKIEETRWWDYSVEQLRSRLKVFLVPAEAVVNWPFMREQESSETPTKQPVGIK